MLGEAAVVGVVPPIVPPGGVSPEAPEAPEPESPQTAEASPTSIIPTVTVVPEAPINELPGLQVVMNAPTGPLPIAADPCKLFYLSIRPFLSYVHGLQIPFQLLLSFNFVS